MRTPRRTVGQARPAPPVRGTNLRHLVLAALTPDDPQFQPVFEDADTTVQAAVPYYRVYDFTNADTMHEPMMSFLESSSCAPATPKHPSGSARRRQVPTFMTKPPFFVLHGEKDELVPCAQARDFCEAMRTAGAAVVAHAELANAHHTFDILSTARSRLAADAVADFLGIAYRRDSSPIDSWPLSTTSAS
ncbi:alpha/beta hydrolase [Mycobacterium tilburgii]|uniref:alpha/beta hydrolase n=1 Tax=Mycobacterium tilburgii TaxID=44467 RepID=UPI001182F222|nr:prolyl oligopeptidase family serine peptidase [Mycobacterium tilburgii]